MKINRLLVKGVSRGNIILLVRSDRILTYYFNSLIIDKFNLCEAFVKESVILQNTIGQNKVGYPIYKY